jgi:hypothetical protein
VYGEEPEKATKAASPAIVPPREGTYFMSLIRLAEPYNLGELVMLQSLLDGSGIAYVVRHANVSSLYPGIPALTSQIFVEERDFARAEHLLDRLRLEVREVAEEMPDGL